MPSRSVKNKTRGSQKRALPPLPTPAPAQNVQSFDGRARTNAGVYEQRFALQDVQGDGQRVGWQKPIPGK